MQDIQAKETIALVDSIFTSDYSVKASLMATRRTAVDLLVIGNAIEHLVEIVQELTMRVIAIELKNTLPSETIESKLASELIDEYSDILDAYSDVLDKS